MKRRTIVDESTHHRRTWLRDARGLYKEVQRLKGVVNTLRDGTAKQLAVAPAEIANEGLKKLSKKYLRAEEKYDQELQLRQKTIDRLKADIEARDVRGGGLESRSQMLAQQLEELRSESDEFARAAAQRESELREQLSEAQGNLEAANIEAKALLTKQVDEASATQSALQQVVFQTYPSVCTTLNPFTTLSS